MGWWESLLDAFGGRRKLRPSQPRVEPVPVPRYPTDMYKWVPEANGYRLMRLDTTELIHPVITFNGHVWQFTETGSSYITGENINVTRRFQKREGAFTAWHRQFNCGFMIPVDLRPHDRPLANDLETGDL